MALHSNEQEGRLVNTVAAYTLCSWDSSPALLRLTAPWQAAGMQVIRGTRWDQVDLEPISSAGLVHIHRDFPRLARDYAQVVLHARAAHIPIVYDYDIDLFNLPPDHPDRLFHYHSDALFPVLQAVVEADAVTVSSPELLEAIQKLNPNTHLVPTCLDSALWSFQPPVAPSDGAVMIGWINVQPDAPEAFTAGAVSFLLRHPGNTVLRVWGAKPPDTMLDLPNVDWMPNLPRDYREYAQALQGMGFVLAVVPQKDHPFDDRSNMLRFFEFSACGIPVICSRVPPYRNLTTAQEDVWLAETANEWEQALELLSQSAEARQRAALNAQETVRKDWLLSSRAHEWAELYGDLVSQSTTPPKNRSLTEQAVRIAGQVREWQRDLEARNHDRDWEVRALNVMMKRKEREASDYIATLNAQLDAVWNSPTYRLLDKIRHPRKLFTRSGNAPASPDMLVPPVQQDASEDASDWLKDIPPARTYDIIIMASVGWEEDLTHERQFVEALQPLGSRLFVILPQRSGPMGLERSDTGAVWIRLPGETGQTRPANTPLQILRQISLDAGIEDAVCWVDDPAWYGLAFSLRNRFGWKVAAGKMGGMPSLSPGLLRQRCDIFPEQGEARAQISHLQGSIPSLYPAASLIVLTYNNLSYTRQCLESIFAKTSYPNFELVVVDNASTDGTVEYLQNFKQAHPSLKLALNQENRGFSAGNNQGVQASSGEYIVFLNNDIVVTQGWLSRLIRHLQDPQVGAAGPVTNSSGNESRIPVDYSDISGLDDFARRYTREHTGRTSEIRMLALFCMALRRSTINQVGLLDERFNVGMYEDDDFSLRVRQKGYRIICAEDVYIHHWGSASFSKLSEERYRRLHEENRAKFEEKWGTRWQHHRTRMEED